LLLLPFFRIRELLLERTGLKTGELSELEREISNFAQNPQIPVPKQGDNRGFQRFHLNAWIQGVSSH
jgi:hypothetical protein